MVFGVKLWPLNNTCRSKARLVGKTVVITGGNTGIGKEVVRDLYSRGARAILMCRDLEKGREAIEDIKRSVSPRSPDERPGELVLYQLNLASFASVRECASKVLQSESALHILINNAGVMACPESRTEDDIETHFQVNHLGHLLLTLLLLPKMQASTPGCRIVNVSSALHYFGEINFDNINMKDCYNAMKAYNQSKLANVLFSKELDEKMKDADIKNINVYSLHPGVVKTELGRYVDKTLFLGARWGFEFAHTLRIIKGPLQGAQTTLHCAVDEQAGKETGLYYSECTPISTSRKAYNPEYRKRFWDLSCKLLKLDAHLKLNELLKQAPVKGAGLLESKLHQTNELRM